MDKVLTVGELRKALEGVPDYLEVNITSDTGVDQGEGTIIVESARRITYNYTNKIGDTYTVDYFEIYANDVVEEH